MRIWDPFVRAFHWTLVASFVVCWLSAQVWEDLHA
jgi:cytochrome b